MKKELEARYEIDKVLVFKITHISSEDYDRLRKNIEWSTYNYDLGIYVFLSPDGEDDDDTRLLDYSYALRRIIALARSMECTHLRFDPDGPTYEGLETFTW